MAQISPYSPFISPPQPVAGRPTFMPRFAPSMTPGITPGVAASFVPSPATSNEAYVTSLYQNLLGRQPDPEGLQAHVNALNHGTPRAQIYQNFVNSPEYVQKHSASAAAATYGKDGFQQTPAAAAPATLSSINISAWFQTVYDKIKSWFTWATTPSPTPTPGPGTTPTPTPGPLPGGGLSTVPIIPAYVSAPIDRSNPQAAVLSAATWVFQTYPQYFNSGEERPIAYQMMTATIGALRAHGFDAYRVVNYPNQPVGDPNRYGKDALVLNGEVYDCYFSWGSSSTRPQALDDGPYGDRPRE